MNRLPHFTRKCSQLRHSKTCKKLENGFFKFSEHSFLSSRMLQNHFVRMLFCLNFALNSSEYFAWLFQKMISISSLKNLQKTGKCSFQMLTKFAFELKVARKPFSKKVPMTKFWFKYFRTLSLTFPENGFKFVTQKFAKIWKIPLSNTQNIRFWAHGSSKAIF